MKETRYPEKIRKNRDVPYEMSVRYLYVYDVDTHTYLLIHAYA